MVVTNREWVGKALDSLKVGLGPFVSREFIRRYRGRTGVELRRILGEPPKNPRKPFHDLDVAALLRVMNDHHAWNDIFRGIVVRPGRSLVNELLDVRNRWAHQEEFSTDDTYRALDSAYRLLALVKSPEADDVKEMRDGLRPPQAVPPPLSVVPCDDDSPRAGYGVYTDLLFKYSTIHRGSCWNYRNRKTNLRPDNYWSGPYASKEQARSNSKTVGQVRECGNCKP